MKIQFYIRGLNDTADLRRRLQHSLEQLSDHISISAAALVVEHAWNGAPAFRAHALLAVPGPDIHAEARDHTFEAVWLKVTSALRKQIKHRRRRQASQVKTNRHVRSQVSRRTGGAIGTR